MGVRSTNKANYGPRWESLNTYFHNGHMGEFFNTQMRAGKGTEPVTGPFDSTGGTKFTYSGKTIHAFTSPGTFSTSGQGSKVLTYFIIAGGGSGGAADNRGGGGGGAGAYHTGDTPQAIMGGDVSFPVVIGAGGPGKSWPAPHGLGGSGEDTVVEFPTGTIRAGGGGYAGGSPGGYRAGGSGAGSGGAAGPNNNTGVNANQWTPISPMYPSPWSGGTGHAGSAAGGEGGGGGGGAGNHAGPQPGNDGGIGGIGVQLPTVFREPTNPYGTPGPGGSAFWVGGGGGGAKGPTGNYNGGGGGGGEGVTWAGGGRGCRGAGCAPTGGAAGWVTGAANTGAGGGGFNTEGGSGASGSGGSGLVLIAYTPG